MDKPTMKPHIRADEDWRRRQLAQHAIDLFLAEGQPECAYIVRINSDRATFARLVDRLPHAIESGRAHQLIAALKWWGAWHGLYDVDTACAAMNRAFDGEPDVAGEA